MIGQGTSSALFASVDLSLIFIGAVIAEVLLLKFIPHGKRVTRFVVMSIFFTV
ncbi:MAG: hypothetical protein JO025_16595, partial [Verrucomicrobia bacterium]|nr:hypothetical protein [Verrucomicrobiota bacterium]